MSCTGTADCVCGCCAGTSVQTPQVETNPPGQPAISYRAGTWASFKESMLARLSSSDYPALALLKTRDDDDFTIAFLDATAVVLDILTFYQERLANESYLGTAVQLRSLTELSRLIGYQPSPGVSAAVYVAFTLTAAPGQPPDPTTSAITIPQGTQVQSVPAQGQTPQVFETSADIQAKVDWTALPVETGIPWLPGTGNTFVYLQGTSTQLQIGDSLLILGVEREIWPSGSSSGAPPGEQWDVVAINNIEVDNIRNVTYVAWDQPLAHASGAASSFGTVAKVFAFRQKAGLFGNNAPDPNLFVNAQSTPGSPTTSLPTYLVNTTTTPWQWANYQIASASQIDLDSTYSKVVVGSWFALTSASATTQILVLDASNNLWLEQSPLGSAPQATVQVDANVQDFQAISATQIFVLDSSGNLWLEQAPFGSVPPSRVQVDGNVLAFQALSSSQVFVLGNDNKLWLEQAPFGSPPPARVQVDSNVQSFQALSSSQVFVLGNNNNLWLEQAPFGNPPPARVQVDGNAKSFQAVSSTQVFVLGNDGNLWLEAAPFGSPPPPRQQVDSNVQSFQALSSDQVFVLGSDANLWLEAAPFGSPPPARQQVDANVQYFHALSSTEALVVDTSSNSWLEYGPFGVVVPPARVSIDASAIAGVPSSVAQLYGVQKATTVSLAKFAMSAKVTELAADYADPNIASTFQLQATQVWAQSDELAIEDTPLDYPLYGRFVDLEDLRPDLVGAQVLALFGNSQKIAVADGVTNLVFVPDDQSSPFNLKPGDIVTLADPTPLPLNPDFSVPDWSSITSTLTLDVEDSSGRPGTVQGSLSNFVLAPSSSSDPEVSEYALIQSVNSVTTPYPHTQLLLQSNLINCYDRNSATVNANVGLATNGQSVSEIMGSGSASTPNQEFTLKQSPLTYVQAPTPTGRQSTLQVQVNGVAWTLVPTLYQQGPSQPVFTTLGQSDGTTDVLFGDGVEGATLPTGQNNLQANYRIGLGSAGNVAAGSITTLIDRPIGVSGVTNPEAATGGEDPDSVDDIRDNAPQTVMTLGRAVSITDYQSYASTFAGIAKANALWIPYGPGRGVFLTVAGVDGAALQPGNPTLTNLLTSLHNYGNPLIPITAQSFLETLFGLSADLQYEPGYDPTTVQAQVLQTLTSTYSFANRTFGQGVSADEVSSIIQAVPGIMAVNVTSIYTVATSAGGDLASQPGGFSLANYNNWLSQQPPVPVPRPASGSPTLICPYLPVASTNSIPLPAEILVLDPDPKQVVLGMMS